MAEVDTARVLRTARVLQVLTMIAVAAFAVALVVLPASGYLPSRVEDLPWIVALLAGISIVDLVLGYFLPRWMVVTSDAKSQLSSRGLLTSHVLGLAFLGAIGVYGLLLGLLGAGWGVTLPFLVVSAMALILTFPTDAKWKKMLE